MLDGKQQCHYGLYELFHSMPDDLKRSQRMTTDYFDVRWYRQAGTVHFYLEIVKLLTALTVWLAVNVNGCLTMTM